jgi:hypothetical protein
VFGLSALSLASPPRPPHRELTRQDAVERRRVLAGYENPLHELGSQYNEVATPCQGGGELDKLTHRRSMPNRFAFVHTLRSGTGEPSSCGRLHGWLRKCLFSFVRHMTGEERQRSCLFVLLLLSFWKNWLMTCWIADYLILGVDFYNLYLIFLHTKNLESRFRWAFYLLVRFFRSLLFSILKVSSKVSCLFLLLAFQLKKSVEKQEQICPKTKYKTIWSQLVF